jgi:hypothetical protein
LVASQTAGLTSRLEDARLNAVYDRTYAREIAFYLKSLHTDMSKLYASTSSGSLKDVLKTTDTNLSPITEEFSNFNAD